MQVELFFDYACPYCYKGHRNLIELLPKYPDLEILWRPCEAHPRPEEMPVHSDMAIQGMHFVKEHGGDIWRYHSLVFDAMFEKKKDISDVNVLSAFAKESGVNPIEFEQALVANKYEQKVFEGNKLAWNDKALDAVPSYGSGDKIIGSRDGILVSKKELDRFLSFLIRVDVIF